MSCIDVKDIPIIVLYLRLNFNRNMTVAQMRSYWEIRLPRVDRGLVAHWSKEAKKWANTIKPSVMKEMLREYEGGSPHPS